MNKLINDKKVIFNVEKVKLNKLPRHFNDADRENKIMLINGQEVKVMINRERTQYVAFSITTTKGEGKAATQFTQHYYVRDHKFFDNDSVETVTKAQPVTEEAAK